MCVCLRGGRESVSNQHFRVFGPQPIGFCILEKHISHSAWFIFLCLIPHFLVRRLVAKCTFHCYSSFTVVMPMSEGRWKHGPQPPVERLKNSYKIFRENYWTDIHVLWNLHLRVHCNRCDVMYAASNSQSFMLACIMSSMRVLFTYQNMCIILKIQLLHIRSDFVTLKSVGGLAVLGFEWSLGQQHCASVFCSILLSVRAVSSMASASPELKNGGFANRNMREQKLGNNVSCPQKP